MLVLMLMLFPRDFISEGQELDNHQHACLGFQPLRQAFDSQRRVLEVVESQTYDCDIEELEFRSGKLRGYWRSEEIPSDGVGLLGSQSGGEGGFVVLRHHALADVYAADSGHGGPEGFGDGARAAGVVEEADVSAFVIIVIGLSPGNAEPVAPLLEGIADLLGDFVLPGFGVVGCGEVAGSG